MKVYADFPSTNEEWTLEKIEQWQREKPVRTDIMMRTPDQSLELVKVFKEASKFFKIIFLFDKAS
jgi:hypothetical protein